MTPDLTIDPSLTGLLVPLEDLTPHPANPRRGDVDAVTRSMAATRIYRALTVQRSTGFVLAGNHQLEAMRRAGLTHAPVVYVDVDEEEATRIVLVDNRSADLGGYDPHALLAAVEELDGNLEGTGYNQDDLDDLYATLEESNPADWVDQGDVRTAADAFAAAARRMVVLDYDQDQFALLTPKLEELRTRYGVDNNADAIRLYLQDQS